MIYLGQDPVGVNSVHSLVIDDNAGNGDTGMTWSADKLTAEFGGKLDASEKGAVNGVAGLDANGKIPSSQLPSYVDDVVEYANLAGFPQTGESGKIYVTLDTNKTYRWGGSSYVEISQSLALGETSTTAYRGDRGAAAYAAAVTNVENSPTEDSNNLITSGAVYEGLEAKMDFDSEYGREVAGVANKLLSDKYTEDNTPYLMRKAYDAEFNEECLVGGTIAWNQLAGNDYGICQAKTDLYSPMLRNSNGYGLRLNIVYGHKYLFSFIQPAGCAVYRQNVTGLLAGYLSYSAPERDTVINFIVPGNATVTQNIESLISKAETTVTGYATRNVQIFDLTQMFGPTIADYIYNLETANVGTGVAKLREWGFLRKSYYAYDAGSLQNVQAGSRTVRGFNQWDEVWEVGDIDATTGENTANPSLIRSKNYISIIPAALYYFRRDYIASNAFRGRFYDADKNYIGAMQYNGLSCSVGMFQTPENACFMRFAMPLEYGNVYKHDICINIPDTNRNGDYEPYKSASYLFDSDLVLRGLPKLNNGRLYYDGDEYKADGTVTRRYGIVNLGTIDWSYESGNARFYYANFSGIKASTTAFICSVYSYGYTVSQDKAIQISSTYIYIKDTAYTDAATFKSAMSGVYLVYELATPITEQADPFTALQKVYQNGTEQFAEWGTRDVEIPVGHLSKYSKDHKAEVDEEISNIYFAKADVEEKYGRSVASIANQVISDQYTENKVPYLMRKAIDAEWDEESLVGGTIAWNQMTNGIGTSNADGITTSYANGKYTIKNDSRTTNYVSGSARGVICNGAIEGHKYVVFGHSNKSLVGVGIYYTNQSETYAYSNINSIFSVDNISSENHNFALRITNNYDFVTTHPVDDITEFTLNIIDLTAAFGPTIADYLYSLETATSGTGVAKLREWGFLRKSYYNHDEGSLQSVQAESRVVRGFNQWDEVWEAGSLDSIGTPVSTTNAIRSKNFCRILPNTTYYMTCGKTDGGTDNKYYLGIYFYDENKNLVSRIFSNRIPLTTPANAYYFKLTTNTSTVIYGNTYNHDICINISDTNRNGEYEPYKSTSYPFDDSLTLRGIPKLDSSNNLYYDGDTYNTDGTVTRRWGYVDMGDLTWQYETRTTEAFFYTRSLSTAEINPAIKTTAGFSDEHIRCAKYQMAHIASNMLDPDFGSSTVADKSIAYHCTSPSTSYMYVYIKDSAYTDAGVFKTAMSGVYLVYELATPTTESAAPYTLLQNVDRYGTEEFTEWGSRDVQIPVGHDSKYYKDKRRETVTDVQINGTSITTNGVANVPTASFTEYGVAKLYQYGGLQIDSSTGGIKTNPASSSIIKTGTNTGYPIVPNYQHESVFYGLAKAAGNADQSSSNNAVGTYTADALKSIRKMLGIPNMKGELIYEVTTTEDLTEIDITVDSNGSPFKLRELIADFTAPASTTGAKDSLWGLIGAKERDHVYDSAFSFPSLTYPTATSTMRAKIIIKANDGMPIETTVVVSSSEGSTVNVQGMAKYQICEYINRFKIYNAGSGKTLIPSGSTLKIYGIRYDD